MDEDMRQLVESVRERGLILPILVRRKEDGRYEIVSGHRRRKACELAGYTSVPAEIREMTRDEAVVLMVESNLQRSRILPSEKAFAYRMRVEALKRQQGTRSDLTSVPVGQKLTTREMVAAFSPDCNTQIQRFIRLTELDPQILEMVDEGQIGLRPAVELSYLRPEEQEKLAELMELTGRTPSHAQAIRLRAFSRDCVLGPHIMEAILGEEKPNQKEQIRLKYEDARPYIPKDVPPEQTGAYILKALAHYKRYRERTAGGRDSR